MYHAITREFTHLTCTGKTWGTTQNNIHFPVLDFFIHSAVIHGIISEKNFVYLNILIHNTLKMSFILYSHFIPNVVKQPCLTLSVIYWCLKVQWIIQPLYPSCFAAHLLSFQSSFISKICSCFAAPISCLAFSKWHKRKINNQKG